MQLTNISTSIIEPVALCDAKEHLRVSGSDDDVYISELITQARQVAENLTGRVIAKQQFRAVFDAFPCEIELPRVELITVDLFEYVDTAGATQTQSAYVIRKNTVSAKLIPAYSTSWPSTEAGYDKVTIEFTAGYENASVPGDIQAAIKLIVGELYMNREDSIQGVSVAPVSLSSKSLLAPYKVYAI